MKAWRKLFLLMLFLGCLALAGIFSPQGLMAQDDYQDYGSGGSGGGGCNYCSLPACGCPSQPPYTTNFTCSCSSIYCSRSCWYT